VLFNSEWERRQFRGHQLQWLTRRAPERKPERKRRLSRDYQRRLVEGVARLLRRGEPTRFAFEAVCRHSLRSGLCLRGWSWHDANAEATEIVLLALRALGAARPPWIMGQPEWTQDGVLAFERTRCIQCGWRLPPENRKFCGPVCYRAFHNERHRRSRAAEIVVLACDDAT
jgi:hypothetical protein